MRKGIGRRRFLRGLGGTAVLTGLAGVGHAFPANDALRIGCIGTGGRMLHALLPSAKEIDGVRIVAVCDVWDHHLGEAKSRAEPDAFATKDYRELLDRRDVDAVIIAAPDHWHVPMTVDACRAGKDVYVEKPLTHDEKEGEKVIEAEARHRRIVQVGMQQRSMPQFLDAVELVRAGVLGTIHKVRLTWNRNAEIGRPSRQGIDPATVDWKRFLGTAPARPFDEYRFRNWRWFWDYGGGILTDLMVHFLDVANWFCELGRPASAATIGDHFRAKGIWETPDTIQTLLHYPDRGVQVYFEGTFVNAHDRAMIEFMGTDATLYLDRARYEVIPENDRVEARSKDYGGGVRGADFSSINGALLHLRNWVECVRERRKPRAPAEAGVLAAWPAHLGNRAYREDGCATA